MLNLREIIEEANGVYLYSADPALLDKAYARLVRLIKHERPSPQNLANAEALAFRIRAKSLTVAYFTYFTPADGKKLAEYLEDASVPSAEKGYTKTYALLTDLLVFVKQIAQVMDKAFEYLERYRAEGQWLVSESAELNGALAYFGEAISRIEELEPVAFGEKVKLFDLKQKALTALGEEEAEMRRVCKELDDAKEEKMLRDSVKTLSLKGEYFPTWSSEGARANCIVLCTPFIEEARLTAFAYARERKCSAAEMSASILSGKTPVQIESLFSALLKKNYDLLVTDLNAFRGDREEILRIAVGYAKKGRRVYLLDETGKRTLYEDAVRGAGSSADVVFHYLTLPFFADTVALFEERGMLAAGDALPIKEKMPFMGYVGLNAACSAFTAGKDWQKIAKAHSDKNRAAALEYLKRILSQIQLIDGEWGKFTEGSESEQVGRGNFDYDDLRGINPRNIQKIIASRGNLFAKCGMAARYCTLCGDDVSVWKDLPTEEKSERLTSATRAVMRLLDTGKNPEVQLLKDEDWTYKGAMGVCVDGGNVIQYREKYMDNYDSVLRCILHECFHGFQHTAVNFGFKRWYWEELGVTKGRIERWNHNFQNYEGDVSKLAYKVEIVEGDANAFAADCFEMTDDVWHEIDFE